MDETITIARAKANEGESHAFARFVAKHSDESGRDGAPFFGTSRSVDVEEVEAQALARWSRRLDEPNWGRAHLLWASSPRRIVGNCELRGGRVRAEMHRATLGMGMLGPMRAKGWGRKLLEATIAWARSETSLDYIDLGVFANNAPAKALYDKLGFIEVGRREDAFRIEGFGSEVDILMTLDLRAEI